MFKWSNPWSKQSITTYFVNSKTNNLKIKASEISEAFLVNKINKIIISFCL